VLNGGAAFVAAPLALPDLSVRWLFGAIVVAAGL
jgi:hypothetical protein